MTVLGIETATTVCAAAVSSGGRVLSEAMIDERYVHAEKLIVMIEEALRESGTSLADMSGIAVSNGPGSFTGLRIGLSVAKGLVYATDRPLIAVPTLEAVARKAIESAVVGESEFLLAALDARRDELYCQLFEIRGGATVPVWEERDLTVSDLLNELGERAVLVTGNAGRKIRAFLDLHQASVKCRVAFVDPSVARCSAGVIARIGEERLAKDVTDDPATLEPRYIKEFFLRTR